MANDKERMNALNRIKQNIATYGFHTYVVTGGGYPHFGYTIGLTERFGAELILAGSYFYRLDDIRSIIEGVSEKLSTPVSWDVVQIHLGALGTFSFRRVDPSWSSVLMLGAFDYYGEKNVQAFQIVPDPEHWTIDVPDLSKPWSPTHTPGWRWLKEEWRYPVPKDSVALTDLNALRGARITEVMRWEEDQWEIFSSAGPQIPESERRIIPLGVLLEMDQSLLPAVDLRVGMGFWREDDSEWSPWASGPSINGQTE